MNDVSKIEVRAVETAERRERTLARFEDYARELQLSPPLERTAAIDVELGLLEQFARASGLFHEKEMLSFRLMRIMSRLSLGDRLAEVARAPGPGRGKKEIKALTSFDGLLDRLKVTKPIALEAQRMSCLPPHEREAFFGKARERGGDDLPTFAELVRLARPYWYQESRIEKHRDIARRARLSTEPIGPFPLIYADPPWTFDIYSDKGLERTPTQHYETLTDEEIALFKVGGKTVEAIADRAATLLLWCTSSNVHRALEIVKAWGFEFKTSAVWDKGVTGLGLVFRNQHELLLYATRGDMPGPQYQPPSVFRFERGEHSAKPPEIRAEIERMYPDFDASTRLELFARGRIEGWSTYGLEAH